jgi:hypothetical protein
MQRHNHVQLPSTVKEAAAHLATVSTRSKTVGHTKSAQNYGEQLAAWLKENPGIQTALMASLLGGGLGAAGAGISEAASDKKRKNYLSRMLTGGLLGAGVGGLGAAGLHYSPEIMDALGISGSSQTSLDKAEKQDWADTSLNAPDPSVVAGEDDADRDAMSGHGYMSARKAFSDLPVVGNLATFIPTLPANSPASASALFGGGMLAHQASRPFGLQGDINRMRSDDLGPVLSNKFKSDGHQTPFEEGLKGAVKKIPWYKRPLTAMGYGKPVEFDYNVAATKDRPASTHRAVVGPDKIQEIAKLDPRHKRRGLGKSTGYGLGALALGELYHRLSGNAYDANKARIDARSRLRGRGQL